MSYLKSFVGQHNPSLAEHLEFAEYEDTSKMMLALRVFRTVAYYIIIAMAFLHYATIPANIPFAALLLKLKAMKTPILIVASILYYVTQSYTNDGAFNMYVNGELVYSKQLTGKYPTDEELLTLLKCKPKSD